MPYNTFNKESLDVYLKELGKEYRRLVGKRMPADIVLVGGAAILINYGFRDMTTDVDAIIKAASSMKDAVNTVGDKFNLPYNWLNNEFLRTDSFTTELQFVSKPYRTFANVLNVRTVSSEYLVAMKLKAGRKYKHDLSDAVGILMEHDRNGCPITIEMLKAAVERLYGSWDALSKDSQTFAERAIQNAKYGQLYIETCEAEKNAKDILVDFQEDYPGVTTQNNVDDILATLQAKRHRPLDEQIHACRSPKNADGSSKSIDSTRDDR